MVLNLIKDVAQPYIFFKGVDLTTNRPFTEQILKLCTMFSQGGLNMFGKVVIEQLKMHLSDSMSILRCPLKQVNFPLLV